MPQTESNRTLVEYACKEIEDSRDCAHKSIEWKYNNNNNNNNNNEQLESSG